MLGKKLIELRKSVCRANLKLVKENLAIFTFGNVSGIEQGKKSNCNKAKQC